MEAQPTALSENEKYHFRMFRNYQEEGIDINNSPQGFSLDSPILIKDYSENRLSNQELNLIDTFNVGYSSSSTEHNAYQEFETELEETADNQEVIRSVYSCNYCQRKFFCWQALGGHQNAHKQERVVKKIDRLQRLNPFHYDNMVMSNHRHSYNRRHRFSIMDSLPPLHGSLNSNNRSITSVQDRATGVLPSFPSNSSHHNLYGQNHLDEWLSSSSPRGTIIDHQPAISRLPSFIHESVLHVPRVNDGGGLTGSKSNQGDSKKIDLVLKL